MKELQLDASGDMPLISMVSRLTYQKGIELVQKVVPCSLPGDACGLYGCTAVQVSRYRGRVSWPLLDHREMHVKAGLPKSFLLQNG